MQCVTMCIQATKLNVHVHLILAMYIGTSYVVKYTCAI